MSYCSRSHRQRLLVWAAACVVCWLSLPITGHADTLIGITNDDNLISVNTANPAGSTLIGALSSPASALGIISAGGNLYIYDTNNNVIDQVDPTTAAIIATINIGIPVIPGEGDLAFYNGVGYLASTYDASGDFNGSTGTLYSFTLSAGSASVISQSIPLLDGLTFSSSGVLYGLAQGGETLFTIDPSTGATLTSNSTGISDDCAGFACFGFGGLTFGSGGRLFASLSSFSGPTSAFFQLDPTTGAATQLADVPFDQVSGLTATAGGTQVTPEPSMILVCLAGLVGLISGRKLVRSRATHRP